MTILHLIRLNGRRRVKSRNYWCVKGNSKPQIPIRPSLTVLWERLAVVGLLIDDDSDWQEEKGVTCPGRGEKEEEEMRLTCKRKGGEEEEGGCWQAGLPRLPRAACKEWTRSVFGKNENPAEHRGERSLPPKYMRRKKSPGFSRDPRRRAKAQIQKTFHYYWVGGVKSRH